MMVSLSLTWRVKLRVAEAGSSMVARPPVFTNRPRAPSTAWPWVARALVAVNVALPLVISCLTLER